MATFFFSSLLYEYDVPPLLPTKVLLGRQPTGEGASQQPDRGTDVVVEVVLPDRQRRTLGVFFQGGREGGTLLEKSTAAAARKTWSSGISPSPSAPSLRVGTLSPSQLLLLLLHKALKYSPLLSWWWWCQRPRWRGGKEVGK